MTDVRIRRKPAKPKLESPITVGQNECEAIDGGTRI